MAGWRRVVELAMTCEEIEKLTALSRSRTEPASRVSRAQMLLAYRENPSFCAVGQRVGVHHQTVQRCVERALGYGPLAAIEDRPGGRLYQADQDAACPHHFRDRRAGHGENGQYQGSGAHRRVFRDHVDLSPVGRGNGSAERQYTRCWWLNRPNHPHARLGSGEVAGQRASASSGKRSLLDRDFPFIVFEGSGRAVKTRLARRMPAGLSTPATVGRRPAPSGGIFLP